MSQDLPHDVIRARRSGGRLAAVQALYQLEQTGQSGASVIRDFMEDRLGLGPEAEPIEEADPDIFRDVVSAVVERQEEIDKAIEKRLASGWKLSRIDSTSRAILRAAVGELLTQMHLSAKIIIDEYVSIGHAFFEEGDEPGFINALLDRIAKDLREEFDG